jgi:hypothetical protein
MKKLFLFVIALLLTQLARAQWEDDIRLTDTPDTSYLSLNMSHCIAASGDTVHLVWYDKSEGNWEIFYKRSIDGGLNWEPDIRLTYMEEFSGSPSLSLSGSAVNIVWEDSRDGNREIYFINSLDGGVNWSAEKRLTVDAYYSYFPVISSSGSYIHVAWVSKDINAQTWRVFYKHSSDGGINWGADTWLSVNSPDAYCPSIAATGSDVYVVWNDSRDGNIEIYYRKSSDSGLTWGPEIRLTNDPAVSNLPSIAVSGSFVHIVWDDNRDGLPEVYYKGSTDGGENWSDDIPISSDPASSSLPNLAVSNSVLHVVWQDFPDIFYSYSTDGGDTWAEVAKLNDFSYSTTLPFIAVSDPVLHVVWCDWRNFNYEIYYKRNPTGGVFVGLEDEMLSNSGEQISIYPNPASRQLTVGSGAKRSPERSEGSRSAVRLSIVDLYGREIKEFPGISSFPYTMDISSLRNGLYFLRVKNDEGKSGSAKFLKIDE